MSYSIDPRLQEGGDARQLDRRALDPARPGYNDYQHSATHTPSQEYPALQDPYHLAEQTQDGDDTKKARACESCRGLKVRCDQDPNDPDAPCRRCAKANRACIYTQPTRKRQKKADTRVTDLERKLDALTAVLHAQQQGSLASLNPAASPTAYTEAALRGQDTAGVAENPAKRRRADDETAGMSAAHRTSSGHAGNHHRPESHNMDTLDRETSERLLLTGLRRELYPIAPEDIITKICSLVDSSLHDKIFDDFVTRIGIHIPSVVFPPGTTAHDVLRKTPILFMAICTTAARKWLSIEEFKSLRDTLIELVIDAVMVQNIKSLELVQTLLMINLFWCPGKRREQFNFYMFVHMAGIMALDLGMGKRFNAAKARRGFGGPARELPPGRLTALVNGDSLESRRAWLGCYWIAAAVSVSLRRPNLLRWSDYMEECTQVLDTAPDAAPSDKFLSHIVRLQRILEEISVSFKMDDPSATAISISDPKVSYTLDIFENKLNVWERSVPELYTAFPTLPFLKSTAVLYLHEIALHVNHNVDDFQLPFTEETLKSVATNPEILTHRQMAALEACLHAAHSSINVYCKLDKDVFEAMPSMYFFIRTMYAVVVLIKMHMAVMAPGSEVAKILKPEDLRVAEYLDMLWELFEERGTANSILAQGKAKLIFGIVRDWFTTHKDGIPPRKEGDAAAQRPPVPYGRNVHGGGSNSKLQVLSEAATAGHQAENATKSWTFDSPSPFRQMALHRDGSVSNTSAQTVETPTNTTNSHSTSGGAQSLQHVQKNFGTFGKSVDSFFSPSNMENLDWTAGMDLDQVLDGAFRDIDTSGDLGGWFFGDGVGPYQIPADGAPPAANANITAERHSSRSNGAGSW